MTKQYFILILTLLSLVLPVQAAPGALSSSPPQSTGESPSQDSKAPLGFKEWKKNQVFDAKMSLDQFKSPQLSKMNNSEASEQAGAETDSREVGVEKTEEKSSKAQNEEEAPSVAVTEPSTADSTPPQGESVQQPQDPAGQSLNQQSEKLRQLEFNLEIAQGLTIHDYFALYLKNKSKQEMAEAIKQLSPDELSELLMAYRKSLYGLPSGDKAPVNKSL